MFYASRKYVLHLDLGNAVQRREQNHSPFFFEVVNSIQIFLAPLMHSVNSFDEHFAFAFNVELTVAISLNVLIAF